MRDEEFKPVDNLKRKCPFCFGTRVLRFLTFFRMLRLSSIKVQKVQKVQKIEKGCGKLILKKMSAFIKKWNDHYNFLVTIMEENKINEKI